MSLRDKILKASDIAQEDVEVPEWDVTIRVMSPTGRERLRLIQGSMVDGEVDIEKMTAAVVIATATDPETGEKIFTADDVDALLEKSGKAFERVSAAAMRVSGMNEDVVESGKDDSK